MDDDSLVMMKLSRWVSKNHDTCASAANPIDFVPVDGREVSCHDETVQMASKKQGTSASAGSPIDFVSAAGTVRVLQNFISWLNISTIDILSHYELVRAAEAN